MSVQIITTVEQLEELLDTLDDAEAAFDFETTGLDPASSVVRLASIANDDVEAVVDFWAVGGDLGLESRRNGWHCVAHWFTRPTWIVFNMGFEMRWFLEAGVTDAIFHDVGYLHRAVEGGGHLSLAALVKIMFDVELDKTEQTSNWGALELTESQLQYAFDDAGWTWRAWVEYEADQRQEDAAQMFDDMVPAVIEMEENGMLLDPKRHAVLIEAWTAKKAEREARLRELVPTEAVANLNSNPQWSNFFSQVLPDAWVDNWPRTEKTGLLSMASGDLKKVAVLAAPGSMLAQTLVTLTEFKTMSKYLSSFGETLITRAALSNGRIHARYNIAAAATGRFSSSAPNLQQMPRDRELLGEMTSVRSSFIAPAGRLIVSLDYSGIELRVLALLSGDEDMLHDLLVGDLHLEVGSLMAGRRLDKSKPEDAMIRSKAKPVSFGIIYGSGPAGVAAGMGAHYDEGARLIELWRARYPRAFDMRETWLREARDNGGYLRMVDGGTINMGKRPSGPQCANYPVQRGGLSVMARAIARHKKSLDALRAEHDPLDCLMLSTIHDALIDEASERDAMEAYSVMRDDMTEGYLDVFPGAPTERLVEGGIGPSWGELEDVE